MRSIISTLLFSASALLTVGCGESTAKNQSTTAATPAATQAAVPAEQRIVTLKTSAGDITLALRPDKAPKTVENFIKLAESGYYDGTGFHRVMKGFMIQGGDPLTKDPKKMGAWGTGGPGYKIKAEFNDLPHDRGVISMARSNDPDSAGSQFFICDNNARFLDGKYTAFGKLIAGDDVLQKILNSPVSTSASGERSRPDKLVTIESIVVKPLAK